MAARVKDVAAAANVSAAAVSRYLNGKLTLPQGTADRIDAAITRLQYQTNPHARRLSLGRSETLGLVVPDIANPFFAILADAIQQAAEAEGFEVLIAATRNRLERELAALDRFGQQRTEGILFVTNHADDGTLARRFDPHHPVVLLDEDIAGTTAPKLFVANETGGRLAAEHLLAHGHRRLGILGGPPGLMSGLERHRGFRTALAAAGAELVFEDHGDYSVNAGRLGAHRMLSMARPPTAVFATSDATVLGLLDATRMRGVAVPGALSVVGFDDIGPWHLLDPPLTAIRQPVEDLGRGGVKLLLAAMRGTATPDASRLPVELISRGTVARPQ